MSRRPRTMRAVIAEAHGANPGIRDVDVPQVGPGEVLVRVMASAVNPLDLKILSGAADHARHPLPAILGIDMAGEVVSVGGGMTPFQVGDEVYGMAGGVGGVPGSLAEYMAADARLLAHKPAGLSPREAAALPLIFITAWEGLVDRAALHPGQSVLVLGGAGGVGQMALQIAKALGAAVIVATGSPDARMAIEALGVAFEDKGTDPAEIVTRHTKGRGFDIVYDTAGGSSLDAGFCMVRRFGHVVSALGWGAHRLGPLSFRAASYSGVFTLLPLLTGEGREHHGDILGQASRLAQTGSLKPLLDPRRFTLATIGEAYHLLETGAARGKVVVDISDEHQRSRNQ